MFCGHCGNQIPDGVGFCPVCGNQTGAQAPVQNTPKKKMSTNTIIGIIAVVAVVVALAIILFAVFAGGKSGASSAEAVVEKYLDATLDFDVDALFECLHEDIIEAAAEEEGFDSVSEFKDELKEQLDQAADMMDALGASIELSYDITDTEELEDDDLDEIAEELEDEFGVKVTAATAVTVEQYTKGTAMGQEIDETETTTIVAVKIDGDWYINPDDFDIG
ncbi:MAG: zinc ribbon domain-containing protein [Clostridia bacterium]|nr:zinc ribbon domain-containing protein [Clostridia bacterium]